MRASNYLKQKQPNQQQQPYEKSAKITYNSCDCPMFGAHLLGTRMNMKAHTTDAYIPVYIHISWYAKENIDRWKLGMCG